MADDTGVWVKLPTATSTTGGGIYTKVADDGGKWVEIGADGGGGELPGLGGWATITAVSGDYTPHRYNDGVTDWVAYEFTDDGTLDTQAGGLVEDLVVGSGSGGSTRYGAGGAAQQGFHFLDNLTVNIEVASAVTGSGQNPISRFGDYAVCGSGQQSTSFGSMAPGGYRGNDSNGGGGGARGAGGGSNYGAGLVSSIKDGNPIEYAHGASSTSPAFEANTGCGGKPNNPGSDGVVIVRVPAANAQNVQETFHGWDSFALVTDGVVTEVTRLPDNEPHTLDAEWLPCPADVQAGWSHADGEFTPPPAPTRDDLIAELKARIKDLQKDK